MERDFDSLMKEICRALREGGGPPDIPPDVKKELEAKRDRTLEMMRKIRPGQDVLTVIPVVERGRG
jgi:hypothetical protein